MNLEEKIKENDIILSEAESEMGTKNIERMKERALILPEINHFFWESLKENQKIIGSLTHEEDLNYYCTHFCLIALLAEHSSWCILFSACEDNIFLGCTRISGQESV